MQHHIVRSLVLFFGCAAASFGQIGRATISGTVTDPQGSVIQGAPVKVTHVETNQQYPTTTTGDGFYVVPGVPVGAYEVAVEMAGFKKSLRKGIVLQVGDHAEVDFRLDLGAIADSVEVTGAAPLVNTSDATVGKVIENARMISLPLNGRSALALVALTPSVRSHAESPQGFGDRGYLCPASA